MAKKSIKYSVNFRKILDQAVKHLGSLPLPVRLSLNWVRTSDMQENVKNPGYVALPRKVKRRDGKFHDMKKGPCCCGKNHLGVV